MKRNGDEANGADSAFGDTGVGGLVTPGVLAKDEPFGWEARGSAWVYTWGLTSNGTETLYKPLVGRIVRIPKRSQLAAGHRIGESK